MKNTMRFSSSILLAVPSPRPRLRLPSLFMTVAISLLLFLAGSTTFGGSATWKANPGSGDWNTASNWTPATVPNGRSDIATFAFSNTTNVSMSDDTEVGSIVFNAGASAFTITANPGRLDILGAGIRNNSGITQNFVAGLIRLIGSSVADMARVELFDGRLDISFHHAPGVTIGSLEGTGDVFLGSRNLTVGSNNLSTTFSGRIQDGGSYGGSGGSLTKIGTGKLVLKHWNSYSGGTTVKRGKLLVNNKYSGGTGSGGVQVDGGWLGGKGIITGAVTVGNGTGSGAVLAPGYLHGAGSPGTLTIYQTLTFNSDGIYRVKVNSSSATSDEVSAYGVTINSGAQFAVADLGTGTLPTGTVFTVIDNTSANPIAGTFSNLADGSTFTSNGNTYQVSYEGGDGNDLTLTVVP
jgi:autotransporter-associated beta strand protein